MAARAEVVGGVLAALDGCASACPPERSPAVAMRVEVLRAVFTHGHGPRVAVVGRRGAGKSSLLNALHGGPIAGVGDVADATLRPQLTRVVTDGATLLWLDTPGLRAGGREGRLDAVTASVRAFEPTALLMLCAATEVDAGIDEDLDDVIAITKSLARPAPLIAVSTRVDELAPPDVHAPPFDDDEKRANIVRSVTTLHRHLLRRGLRGRVALPVCALTTWRDGVIVDDARWNLGALTRAITSARGAPLDRDLTELLRGLCDEVIESVAGEAARVAMEAPASRRGELLASAQASLVRCLDELLGAFTGRRNASVQEALGESAKPGMFSEALRGVLDGVGARRAGAAVASGRVRALGRAVMALEALRPRDEVLDATRVSTSNGKGP